LIDSKLFYYPAFQMLFFHEAELARVKRRGFLFFTYNQIPTFWYFIIFQGNGNYFLAGFGK